MIDLFFAILSVGLNIWVLLYLSNLKKLGCECAMDWRRSFIMAYILFALGLFVLQFLPVPMEFMLTLSALYVLFSIANVVVVLTYIYELERKKCNCSDTAARLFLKIVAILNAIVYTYMAMVLIYLFVKIRMALSSKSRLAARVQGQLRKLLRRK